MIYKVYNVFSDERRKDILEKSKKHLKDLQFFKDVGVEMNSLPGLQTPADLHTKIPFASEIQKSIKDAVGLDLYVNRSWVNWTNGKKKDVYWHTHNAHYAAVYYLKTPLPFFSNGTLFRSGFVKAPQNSLLLFSAHLEHTAPTSPFRLDRYTLGMDLMKR